MRRFLWLLALTLCVVGCGPKPEEDALVRSVFENVRLGQYDAIEEHLAENLKSPDAREQLETIRREYIPAAVPTTHLRLNWSSFRVMGGDTQATFVHRYDYADRVLLVTTVTRTQPGGAVRVEGLHVNVTLTTAETIAATEFSVLDKPPRQLAFFTALICSAVVMIIAFFGVIFTKGFERKWLFAPIAFVGAPIFVMNWTTGEWVTQISLGLINTGVMRSLGPLDPWMAKFQLPIGALIVLSLLIPWWLDREVESEGSASNR